jgi:3'-phosphoadenosine 5'-phosphosulfate sulfotransferase (PAPS reductase)/FAD synthetase
MATAVQESLAILRAAREKSSSCLVAYSDGKDSRVVMDLCLRTFERVEGMFMYTIPDMECEQRGIAEAEVRWGVKIHQYPHWWFSKMMRQGSFCDPWHEHDWPEWKLEDIYALAMHDTGIPIIATGAKRADSRWRRRMLATWGNRADTVYPIVGWSKPDVVAYCALQEIPMPSTSKGTATGIDLTVPSVLWLHDTYPRDFERLCQVFPYARAIVERRRLFGV